MVHWIFFDVGNVLLDEDPLTYHNVRRHAEAVRQVRPDLSFFDLLAAREARAADGSRWPLHEVVSGYLDGARCDPAWDATPRETRARYEALPPPVAGACELVERLPR